MVDSYWHKGLRHKLIEELQTKGIKDSRVLEIMKRVPRHFFIDSALASYAYQDNALPIECNQTLSHPYTVAYQTQLLDLQKSDKVLEVGTGSGYQSVVLAEYKASIYTIERQRILYKKFLHHPILQSYPNIKCFYGDGYKGLMTYAPFDKMLITAAAPVIPHQLLNQLKVGGMMVIPVNSTSDKAQEMKKIIKYSETTYKIETYETFHFVPMLEGKEQ